MANVNQAIITIDTLFRQFLQTLKTNLKSTHGKQMSGSKGWRSEERIGTITSADRHNNYESNQNFQDIRGRP